MYAITLGVFDESDIESTQVLAAKPYTLYKGIEFNFALRNLDKVILYRDFKPALAHANMLRSKIDDSASIGTIWLDEFENLILSLKEI